MALAVYAVYGAMRAPVHDDACRSRHSNEPTASSRCCGEPIPGNSLMSRTGRLNLSYCEQRHDRVGTVQI